MYVVKYVENGEEKQTEEIADRDEAFRRQTGLLAKRKRNEDGTWDIDVLGVWNLNTHK